MLEESKVVLLRKAYQSFNARDIDGVLATMHPDVERPNGMEGGIVHGVAGVREYWTRQWGMLDPQVEPKSFDLDAAGRVVVGVHQVVRDLSGKGIAGSNGRACVLHGRRPHSRYGDPRVNNSVPLSAYDPHSQKAIQRQLYSRPI